MNSQQLILIEYLNKVGLLKIQKIPIFSGNKQNILYRARLLNKRVGLDLEGFGYAINNPQLGLIKSLCELIERYGILWKKQDKILYATLKGLDKKVLPIENYFSLRYLINKRFGWVNGECLTPSGFCQIPAQLVYNRYRETKEVILSPSLSLGTGAACGPNSTSAILSGIYEIIERDAFMTRYINTATPQEIDLTTVKNLALKQIIKMVNVHLFDITNDLNVLSFLSIVINKNNFYIGLKSSIYQEIAIMGAIEESILELTASKYQLLKKKSLSSNDIFISKQIIQKEYLNNKTVVPLKKNKLIKQLSQKEELSLVTDLLKRKGVEIYNKNCTPVELRNSGYMVIRVIIPKLQPLSLTKTSREIRKERIKNSALFFKNSFDSS